MSENKHLVNELSKDTKRSLRTRIISALVAVVILVPVLFIGDYAFLVFMLFLLGLCIYEIIHCAGKKYSIWLYIVSYVLAIAMSFWPIIHSFYDAIVANDLANWRIYDNFNGLSLPITALVVGACALFIVVVLDRFFEVRDACYVFTMTVIISIAIQSILYLRYFPLSNLYGNAHAEHYFNSFDNFESALLVIYIGLATFMTDIGAYFVGIFFGKHKMNERISPKKTWEGFFGGLIISTAVSFLFAYLLALGNHPVLANLLDTKHWYYILLLSFIIPPIAVLGDFVFSSIKRYYGIKDFGKIMPGHGGALDRIDSIIFTTMVSALIISLFVYWM